MITVGHEAISRIRDLKVDLCFLGINAINLNTGVSDNDWEVAQIKKAMISSSDKLVCLTISEKLDSQQPIQICDIKKIDMLITELSPEDDKLETLCTGGYKGFINELKYKIFIAFLKRISGKIKIFS